MFEFEQPPWLKARVHANNHPSHSPTKPHKTNFSLKIKYKNLKPAIRSKAIVNETIQKKKNTHNHRVQKRCARLSCQYHWLIGSTQTLHRDRTEKMAQNENPQKKIHLKYSIYFACKSLSGPHTTLTNTADRPLCRPEQQKIYGVARNEAAKIFCEVDSFPPPESFKWSFNNTAEMIDMPQNGFEKHSLTTSKLTYIPVKVGWIAIIYIASSYVRCTAYVSQCVCDLLNGIERLCG